MVTENSMYVEIDIRLEFMKLKFIDSFFLGLHIELGDCRSYHYDMIFLRNLFASRQEISK